MKPSYVLIVIISIICALLLFFKTKQVYRLKRENAKLKEMLVGCKSDLDVSVQYVKNYERAFEIVERHYPHIARAFDLLINGIDPWQKRSTKTTKPNSNSQGKTMSVNKPLSVTNELILADLFQ